MKRSILLVVALTMLTVCISACGGKEDNGNKNTTTSKEVESTTVKEEKTTVADDKVEYKVTVVDEEGNPIIGAMVQCCKEACVPALTNDNGVAEFKLAEDDYDVKFVALPEGYEYSTDEEVFHFEDGKTELTITLKKTA